MLFSGRLACFSPSVMSMIRKLWVKNGGTLTHTDADFKKANYFFCDGMNDPWLNELLSRNLIVRHASWVTLCVIEDFWMPIAAYTLDGDHGFEVTKIRILEPPGTRKETDITRTLTPTDIIMSKETKAKRPFDIDDSTYEEEERPLRKKARTDAAPELYDQSSKKTTSLSENLSTVQHGFNTFPKSSRNVSRTIGQRFQSQIRQTIEDCNDISTSRLNPFSLFWNDLLERRLSEDQNNLTTLSVDDLLHAPRARATVFTVNTEYFGRKFVDLGPATQLPLKQF